MTISVERLPKGEYTIEGAFYAKVDGFTIGESGRSFWQTRKEALDCAKRYVAKVTGA